MINRLRLLLLGSPTAAPKPFLVVSRTSTKDCVIARRSTPRAANRALADAITRFEADGFAVTRRERLAAHLTKYLDDLDIYLDIDLVVEHLGSPFLN